MIRIVKKHPGLLIYSSLNILDKGFIFLIPLIVLLVFKDKSLYNEIEYIYAIASFLIIFLDFGIKNYFFYKYKETKDKAHLLKSNRIYINFLLYFYSFILLCFIAIQELIFNDLDLYLYIFIFIRSLYSLLISFYSYYFRLIDKPSKIYIYSLSISFLTIGLIGVLYFSNNIINLFDLFIFQILLISLSLYIFRKLLLLFDPNEFMIYAKEAFLYSYPIIINIILMTIINQFGKVYAYNFLSPDEMTTLSLIQRLALLIVLIHGSLSGYFSKELFIKNTVKIHLNILILYSSLLLLISFSIVILGYLNNIYTWTMYTIDTNLLTLLTISTLLWCFTAYTELYFNRQRKNKYIPLITLVGFIAFCTILILNTITINIIIYAMIFSNLFSLIYSIILLKQKKVLEL